MAFEYVLANLLANTERAVGVMFLDESGETVDMACSEFTPYQMRVVGAYLGIYLRQLGILAESKVIGPAELLHIEKEEIHLFAAPLADGYYLALIQRRPAVVARTLRSLRAARDELVREIFS